MDFSAWVVSGLMLVAGATWLIVYNADVLLGATMRVAGRVRALAPVLKMAMAYPLRVRFRTGVTLAMFTLVVFTIVVGATTSRAFLRGDRRRRGLRRRLRRHGPGGAHEPARRRRARPSCASCRRRSTVVASETVLSAKMAQAGDRALGDLSAARLRRQLPQHDDVRPRRAREGLRLAARRLAGAVAPSGPGRDRRARRAAARQLGLRRRPRAAPARLLHRGRDVRPRARRRPRPAHRQHADGHASSACSPTPCRSRWPACGRRSRPPSTIFGARAVPTVHHLDGRARASTRTRRRASSSARSSRTAWRPSRCAACSHDATGASYTLNWLILGFMGLGLIVGVAALGVISARVGRRAPPADRRAALDRLPPRHGAAELPARVLVHRADRDRRRHRARPDRRLQRRRRRRRAAVLAGLAARSRCRGRTWRSCSSPSSPPRC